MSSIEKAVERLSNKKTQESLSQLVDVSSSGVETHTDSDTVNQRVISTHQKDRQNQATVASKTENTLNDQNQNSDIYELNNNTVELDLTALALAGYITPKCTNKALFEEYRIIKRPILMNAYGKGAAPVEYGNLITVTSSLPGEGKTFTALNLALSIASELDSTVLIIDGDVLRASLSKLLGLEYKVGLTDVLLDSSIGIEDVLVSTQIPKLKVIPAGTKHGNSTELLSSDLMANLVKELGSRYQDRIILFDSPPLLATSESLVLNQLMGQILMVVEAGKTPVDAVKDSLSHINNEKVIGMVLNKASGRSKKHGYGNYYGGYY